MGLSRNVNRHDILFYISLGLYLCIAVLSESFYYAYFRGTAFKLILLACVGLLLVRELSVGLYTLRGVLFGACCAAMLLLMKKNGSSFTQTVSACIWLYIFAARNLSFARIARFSAAVCAVSIVFVVLSALCGMITNYVVETVGGRVREYLGFRYALYGPAMVLNVICLEICGRRAKLEWWRLAVLALASIGMYWFTNSRLSFLLSLLMIGGGVFLKLRPRFLERHRRLCILLACSLLICFVASVVLTAAYDRANPVLYRVNQFLEGRLVLGKNSLDNSGVKLLGQKITWIGNGLDVNGKESYRSYTYVDSIYIQLLQREGIVFTLAFLAAFTAVAFRCVRRRKYHLLLALAVFSLRGVLDDLSLHLQYNTLWLAIGTELLSSEAERKLPERHREEWNIAALLHLAIPFTRRSGEREWL